MPEEIEKLGIEEFQEALFTVVDFAMAVDSALEDNKVSIPEGVGLGIKLVSFWRVVKLFPVIKAQFLDMDAEEKVILTTGFADRFDLRDDQLEGIVEMIVGALLQFGDLVSAFKPTE